MDATKRIAIVAHDHRKPDLLNWILENAGILIQHELICTGTTGRMVEKALTERADQPVRMTKLKSGPLGGDQQLGAMIAEGRVDFIIFFWDPMQPHPHDVDVKALLRIAVVYNIPMACNRSTADFMISSPIMQRPYTPEQKDYSTYLERAVAGD